MSVQTSTGAVARQKRDLARQAISILTQPWVWVAALTLVGLLLRRYHLGTESLWFDEADIAQRARQSLPVLLESFTKAGENGPLYTLLLHYWLSAVEAFPFLERVLHVVFGHTDEAIVRGPAALFGAASIPLIYLLGKRVGGAALGLIAAALLTFNPFDIWHSQDAKMYTLLVFMTLLTSLLYLLAWERNTVGLWLAYVVATWVMLTIHSMALLVFIAQLAIGIAECGVRSAELKNEHSAFRIPHSAIRWGWAVLLIILPILPIAWLRAAALLVGTDVGGWYAPTALVDILTTIFVKFAVNQAPQPWEVMGAVTMGVLALIGLFWILDFGFWSRGKALDGEANPKSKIQSLPLSGAKGPKWLVVALWLIPTLLFWLVTLSLPLFQPRYLIMSLPAYLIMAAAGLLALRRVHWLLAAFPAVLLGLTTFAALFGVNYSSEPQKEDWRGAMAYVQDHLRSRDVMVVFPGYMVTAVNQYYEPGGPGNVPQVDVKTIPSLETEGFGERELDATLMRSMTCHERAWLITSPVRQAQEDPRKRVQEWFQYNWHTFDTQVFNGVTVYGVSFNGQPDCWYPGPDYYEQHGFTNGLEFIGYKYQLRREDNNQPDASYFPLSMYWRINRKMNHDYIMRVMLKDQSGKTVVDEALGPLNNYWPTTQWLTDTVIIDYRDLRLPGGLPPGDYTVSLQLYPNGLPDQPLKLREGGTEFTLEERLRVVPWKQ